MSNFLLKDPDAILIHIPKTGGSTIRRGIWEANYEGPEYGIIPETWPAVFKFAFVRHPLDRLASAYRDFSQIRNFRGGFERFLDIVLDENISYVDHKRDMKISIRHHTIPQTHPFNCLSDADFVGRYEEYENDLREILFKLGLEVSSFPSLRKTEGKGYRELFKDPYDWDRALRYYEADYRELGYEPDL